MPPTSPYNPFPDCLCMKLHCEPISSVQSRLYAPLAKISLRGKTSKIERVSLKLTLRFGEQQDKFGDSINAFGLRGGQLRLKLTNAKLLLETIQLPDFLASVPVEKQEETSRETEGGLEFKLAGGIVGKKKDITKTVKKYQNKLAKVYSQGTETEPIWQFQPDANDTILRGMLQEETIGIIEISKKPCFIEAFFEFQEEDILTTKPGIIAHDIGVPNTAFLGNILTVQWIKSQLRSNIISEAELRYE